MYLNVRRSNERKWSHTQKKKERSKRSHKNHYRSDDLVLLVNILTQAKSLLASLEHAAQGISLYINSDKTLHEF